MKKLTTWRIVGKNSSNNYIRQCINCGFKSDAAYRFNYCPMCGYQILKRVKSVEKIVITD